MDEWISDEMTFLLGEQKASRETRSCWPFFKDSYNVFSHTHSIHPWLLILLLLPAVCFCSVLFLLVQWPMDGSFSPFSFASSFFFASRYIKVPYLLCNVYVYVYIVYSRC